MIGATFDMNGGGGGLPTPYAKSATALYCLSRLERTTN